MNNSKLVLLLRTLTGDEMNRFLDFVRSPYFNSNSEVAALAGHLKSHHPDFPEQEIEKAAVFRALFPGKPFNGKKLSYLMSNLLKLAERFLGIQYLESEENLLDCYILEQLTQRNLEKHYNFLNRNLDRRLTTEAKTSPNTFFYQYLLSHIGVQNLNFQRKRVFDENLQRASNALDDYYFIHKLKYSCEMLNRQAILSDRFSIPFMDEVKDYLSRKEDLKPLVAIYLSIYFSLLEPEEDDYLDRLRLLIKENSHSIEKTERKDIYLYALNLCVRKIRQSKEKYLPITLDLYVEGIRNQSLFTNNHLSHWTYNNIVKLALRLKRFDWTENFIRTHTDYLQQQFQKDARHYNLAELYFHKKNYDEALIHLNQVRASDIHYHLGSRILLIKTFYESQDFDPLHSLLASFSVYLSRNKQIATPLKKSCQNFCNLVHKILLDSSRKKREKLWEQVKETQPLADRPWLIKVFKERNQELVG